MWDNNGKHVGINDKTQHNLPWPNDQLRPLVHGKRTLPNCLTTILGVPITTKMALALVAMAKTVSMCALLTASISALLTYIHAGRSK